MCNVIAKRNDCNWIVIVQVNKDNDYRKLRVDSYVYDCCRNKWWNWFEKERSKMNIWDWIHSNETEN